jgi:hypothetical protein
MAPVRSEVKLKVKPRNRTLMSRLGPPVVVAAIMAGGLYLYYREYGDTSSAYDRAIADCVQSRTRVVNTSRAREEATIACVRQTPGGQ